jgi:hypothetical protein
LEWSDAFFPPSTVLDPLEMDFLGRVFPHLLSLFRPTALSD